MVDLFECTPWWIKAVSQKPGRPTLSHKRRADQRWATKTGQANIVPQESDQRCATRTNVVPQELGRPTLGHKISLTHNRQQCFLAIASLTSWTVVGLETNITWFIYSFKLVMLYRYVTLRCAVLRCAALRCVVLCCLALCCGLLNCAVSCCILLCCVVLCCVVLCCVALCYVALRYVILR